MNRTLASIGIATAVICGSAAPDAPQSGVNTPSAKPSHSEMPIPSTRPTKTVEATKPSETKLAKTGTFAGVLAVLVTLIAAFGSIFHFVSRKENN